MRRNEHPVMTGKMFLDMYASAEKPCSWWANELFVTECLIVAWLRSGEDVLPAIYAKAIIDLFSCERGIAHLPKSILEVKIANARGEIA